VDHRAVGNRRAVPERDAETTWTARPFVPDTTSWSALQDAARGCRGCPLYADATQVVFGEGSLSAAIVLVGEQPGDQEDRKGHPFVGPAGGVLWACVESARIAREDVYATNAVKHFKHEPRGKRRIHQKPTTAEVQACHPWIEAELAAVRGRVLVALGATAARSLLGRSVPIAASRGTTFRVGGVPAIVTYHPSAVLRTDDAAAEIRRALIEDLERARSLAELG
jgi:DNA polymerase